MQLKNAEMKELRLILLVGFSLKEAEMELVKAVMARSKWKIIMIRFLTGAIDDLTCISE